jgi:hypothetical protein
MALIFYPLPFYVISNVIKFILSIEFGNFEITSGYLFVSTLDRLVLETSLFNHLVAEIIECFKCRGPGFLAVVWFGSSPNGPPPPFPSASSTGDTQEDRERETTCSKGGRGVGGREWGRSQIIHYSQPSRIEKYIKFFFYILYFSKTFNLSPCNILYIDFFWGCIDNSNCADGLECTGNHLCSAIGSTVLKTIILDTDTCNGCSVSFHK